MSSLFKRLCGRTLRVKEDAPGRKVPCPDCGEILAVPQPSPSDDKLTLRPRPFEPTQVGVRATVAT
jgi:hypothetical protein